MTISEIHSIFLSCDGVATDTRKITSNCFYVALKGENFDANSFAKEALQNGAAYALIDNEDYYLDDRTILTEDSLATLQELAKYHRKFLNLPIIAITGSNGKTTTKETVAAVLSKKYKIKATVGNLNNHIGVPLTLLSFNEGTELGIVEMGANHQKEIEFLCSLATPDFGYITNFGLAHLEGFGGYEGVIKGKSEMYTYLSTSNKMAFVNFDDPIQKDKTSQIQRYSFSENDHKADLLFSDVQAKPFVQLIANGLVIQSQLLGLYNAENIKAAIAIGSYFEVNSRDIKDAVEHYVPTNNRSQMIAIKEHSVILDAYNANPSSMATALQNFKQLEGDSKIAILGDMFELGNEGEKEHKNIIESLLSSDIEVYFVGKHFFKERVKNDTFRFYETFDEFSTALRHLSIQKSTILIKGSRGMALERTLELL
ncbi:UDP-N-acetylmuramoyl-tripeptide--D-alanyl-D-alanine ligase [Flavobacterium ardleyense]|uniref:UDP-N-acetylmuramoyl-tripeptide--D-alanyl-D- alanine ligase n=1 Tax=Flavobacterium ardleyense TaxID=2038737 RepID=UPI00298C9109|nr:UDP-N-acetylmuramoyl-tripeptide--D-alanyl-D-alanine ligase [Flavobacterium ardleyense]